MLRKDVATSWTEECQKAFNKIKEYLSKLPVLVPLELGRPLLLYLSMLDGAFGCILGQHDKTGRKQQAIYYLSKKFTPYEAVKGQALVDHLAENLVHREYEPLKTYFPEEEVSFVGEDITKAYDGWGMFFDGAANFKGVGIRVVLVSETGQHYPLSAKLMFLCTNNMAKYEVCILGLRLAIDMNVQELLVFGDFDLLVHQVLGEWATKNTKKLPYLHCVQELIKRFTKIDFKHVPRFILVAVDYFTKWVEAASYKAVTKKVIAIFVRDRIICRFGVPKSIITDNVTNLNSDLMKAMCETFKIKHRNSTAYSPQMNGVVEAANKNIKKILRKMVDNYK
ncbi:uncharacterized protein [Nicotiana tomentosiformis]|uniref:uncharacterized protein n=1 Tax=Nicotiana tomentosiformis TaxID=4098 RepID=UPI00388CBB35